MTDDDRFAHSDEEVLRHLAERAEVLHETGFFEMFQTVDRVEAEAWVWELSDDAPNPPPWGLRSVEEGRLYERPFWVSEGTDQPDAKDYQSAELFVAGALSTVRPFDVFHPTWALPFARQALDALGRWEPDS